MFTGLKGYNVSSLVLSSETGMPVARLRKLFKENNEIKVQARWKGLSAEEDTLEPFRNVFEVVPKLHERLLNRKNASDNLAREARDTLGQ